MKCVTYKNISSYHPTAKKTLKMCVDKDLSNCNHKDSDKQGIVNKDGYEYQIDC